jgi:hypothetical protein
MKFSKPRKDTKKQRHKKRLSQLYIIMQIILSYNYDRETEKESILILSYIFKNNHYGDTPRVTPFMLIVVCTLYASI